VFVHGFERHMKNVDMFKIVFQLGRNRPFPITRNTYDVHRSSMEYDTQSCRTLGGDVSAVSLKSNFSIYNIYVCVCVWVVLSYKTDGFFTGKKTPHRTIRIISINTYIYIYILLHSISPLRP